MTTISRAASFYQFTIHYSETPALRRILAAATHAGAEPAWVFTRTAGRIAFRLDVAVGGLSPTDADRLAGVINTIPAVARVVCTRSSLPFASR